MKNFKFKKEKGFTLLELLLYVGITSMILGILSLSILFFISSRVKTQTITEVTNDVGRSLNLISKYIRNSKSINSPTPGNSSNTLNLEMSDPSKDPTVITVSSGIITVKEGADSPIAITNELVEIIDLEFRNYSKTDTPGIIQIFINADHKNDINRNEYNFNMSATTSASILEYEN